MKLIVQVVVGFMYKVQKNKLDTSKFNKEFSAIRHGDYFDFFSNFNKEIDFIVTYTKGTISNNKQINKDELDFISLVKIGESLIEFYNNCLREYGNFKDSDIPDEIFEKASLFELSLRMHLNNNKLIKSRVTLENVINEIRILKDLTDIEVELLHKGRKFLNSIKRPEKMKQTWEEGIFDFSKAYEVLEKRKIKII